MIAFMKEPEMPKQAEPVYIPLGPKSDVVSITYVDEFLEVTMNGCYKVTDATGRERIIKRFPSKDKGAFRAWLSIDTHR